MHTFGRPRRPEVQERWRGGLANRKFGGIDVKLLYMTMQIKTDADKWPIFRSVRSVFECWASEGR